MPNPKSIEAAAEMLRSLGWTVREPIQREMSDEDRQRAIDLLQEQSSEQYFDNRKEAVETLIDATLDGLRGLNETSDEVLLEELRSGYGDDELNNSEELVTDESLRIWAKYRKPDLICGWCGGTGDAAHASDPVLAQEPVVVDKIVYEDGSTISGKLPKCSLCNGTGAGSMFREVEKPA